jgi:hypothetical protein
MTTDPSVKNDMESEMTALGIRSIYEWDVLVFLYRHRTCILSAENIARLLGFPTGPVVLALEFLESVGLISRSRTAGGVRLYQLALPQEPRRVETLDRVMAQAGERAARLGLLDRFGVESPGIQRRT